MQMIYNSPNYCVVEFPAIDGHRGLKAGGYEIVDKTMRREMYIDGTMATQFREHVQKLIERQPTLDEVDEWLGQFDDMMHQTVILH
jgi:hypothetical protein